VKKLHEVFVCSRAAGNYTFFIRTIL